MTPHDLSPWLHDHLFDKGNAAAERSTQAVLWITLAMMVIEIAAGWYTNSMALMADGFHMSSHAVAIGMTVFAYSAARRQASDPRFAFGTWKIEVLAGFASAIFLLVVIALMLIGSVERLFQPEAIHYPQAISIAIVGLVVNLVCAWLLGQSPGHGHGHDHGHGHGHETSAQAHAGGNGHVPQDQASLATHQDLNLRSAYVHVLADAATSVLAIFALAGGWWMGWAWLDPVMGIVGAVLVAVWAKGLIAQTAVVLLDREMDHPVVEEIRDAVRDEGEISRTYLTDLHVWRVGRGSYSCAMTVLTHDPALSPNQVRAWFSQHEEIVHATVEVQRCQGDCTA